MDAILLARIKFALTIGFHFLFPPLTIGLAWLLVWLLWKHWRTGQEWYGRAARFWLRLFALTFALGVATGVTMEFQFGTNWSLYSRFVGDVFGSPLAAEGIFSFFLESTFVGVLLAGWGRLSRRTMWFASLMVAGGATLSALWIVIANSWMQTPAGFRIAEAAGAMGRRAVLTDFWAAALNPSTLPRYFHVIFASLVTGAFAVMGISAWYLLKRRHTDFAHRTLRLAVVAALLASLGQLAMGHWHGVQVGRTQPAKLAAYEGLFETEAGAPMIILGIPDVEKATNHYVVQIPKLLSALVTADPEHPTRFDINATVPGLKAFPRDLWPPITLTFYPFHVMSALGTWFILLGLWGAWLRRRGRLPDSKWFLRAAVCSVPLPFLANELGWIAAEVGRQPWIVYGVLRTDQAATPASVVPAGHILGVTIGLGLLYTFLLAVYLYAAGRIIRTGPGDEPLAAAATPAAITEPNP
jgi:cytochrome d ubiquinol oxidase subunit I